MTWVDCYFPCYRPSTKSHRGRHRLIFAGASDGKEIWTLIVEKAFAKVAGSYEAISGGQISTALEMLTGGKARRCSRDLASEWDNLKQRVTSDEYFVGAGSHQLEWNATDAAEQKKTLRGIVTGHAYSVLAVYEDEGLRLVELRNPWGRVMYSGDWGPGSRRWNSDEGRRARSVVGALRTQEGRFWMAWEDFLTCFDSVDICHMNFTEEDRARSAALREEADKFVAKKDRPNLHSSGEGGSKEGQVEHTQESADAMMALLLAEDAEDKQNKKTSGQGKKKGGKKKGKR